MQRRWIHPLPCLLVLIVGALMAGAARGDELLPADRLIPEVVDHYLNAKLARLNVQPASPAADTTLLRRTMLDLVGRIPTAAEAQSYAASGEAKKREQLVDRLMETPAYVRHQADEFDTLLMYGSKASLRTYLREAFAENRPWDQMFREMLIGQQDDSQQDGAIQFVKARVADLDKLVNETSVVFFGVNVSCAQCHDHPLVPDWTQEHFYGMKSFFNRSFDNGGFLGEKEYGTVSYQTTDGDERNARLMFLTGTVLDEPELKEPSEAEKKKEKQLLEDLKKKKEAPPAPEYSRRARLVEIALRDEERDFFARAIVNHVWYRLYGNGLVMPLDQMHPENPPSHPELMEWLARDLVDHGYDLKRLIRGLILTDAYARTSRWEGEGRPLSSTFGVMQVRPLSPQQYAMTLKLGSTSPDSFAAEMKPEDLEKRIEGIENGARGLAGLFDQPHADFQVSVTEALLMSNSDRLAKDLLREGGDGLLAKLDGIEDAKALVETAIWNILSRPPDDEEIKALGDYLTERSDHRPEAIRQIVWALLASAENRFNY
jgi:hypothetical protein